MFKKLNKMKIGARLKKSFRQIILIFGILSALVVVIMLYTINNYGTILDNYAYPQGDIAMAMNESAEVRAASRGIVGYDSDILIESMKEQHEQAVKSFEEYLEKIRPTMITKEGTACMDAIDKAWAEYKEVDAKVIEVGATTDTAKSLQAQQMMTDEAAPKYQALDDALQKLMSLNISLGNAKRAQLRTVMIAALTIIIIVIAVSTIYSNSLSVAISKSIEKPLNELKDRFITFAEGDIDSPLPTVESEDEIKELVSGVSAMSDRIRVIIKDSGRMLNEMSEGNFAIDTECEEVYTGAFTDLLTGIRKMNEEIDTTVRGVDDASGQVLTGSTNLAEAAQSLAEGATDQAASVEEMQATINELTSGIKTTAEEKIVKYLDIPIQHCDGEILRRMYRPGNETMLRNLIAKIREKMPDVTLRTTLITGFPGETKEQFNALGDFVQDMQFDRLGCFAYSEEEGTDAAEYEDQIDEETREHRAEILMQQQAELHAEKNAAKIGTQMEAVIEGFDPWAGCYFGRTRADAPEIDGKIFIRRTKEHQCGDYVQVEVFDTMDYDLLAEEVEEA